MNSLVGKLQTRLKTIDTNELYSPAFQNGRKWLSTLENLYTYMFVIECPFSTKSEKEVLSLMSQIPQDHPTLNMSGKFFAENKKVYPL